MQPEPGKPYGGSGQNETSVELAAGIRAIDPQTSKVRWDFKLNQGSFSAGVLSTAGNLVFAASREGHLIALMPPPVASLALSNGSPYTECADVLQRGRPTAYRDRR